MSSECMETYYFSKTYIIYCIIQNMREGALLAFYFRSINVSIDGFIIGTDFLIYQYPRYANTLNQ